MRLKNFKVSQKEFTEYYLTHSWKNICEHFNITERNIRTLNKKYNISQKQKFDDVQQLLTKEELLAYFNNHSFTDTQEYFEHKYNIKYSAFTDLVNLYKINKTEEDRKQQRVKTSIDRYGIPNPGQANYTNLGKQLIYNQDASILWLKENYQKYDTFQIAILFGCSPSSIRYWAQRYNLYPYIKTSKSHYEKEIKAYLISLGITNIESNRRDLLPSGLEIDIYLPDFKLGIEFNGDYWHSSLYKEKKYHYNKSIEAEKAGIHLVHIWEHEWEDPHKQELLKTMLSLFTNHISNKIYARQCEVRELTNVEAKPFNNANHLQGHRNAQITYGLFYKDQLVQLMSFSKTKYNRNLKGSNDWEIIRGCPGSLNLVVGGVSKLFAHFVKEQNPDKVFSYCDFNKFTGVSYEKLGMKFIGYTGPDKKWLLEEGVIPRQPKKYKELKARAIAEIWGAGSKKYIWNKNL